MGGATAEGLQDLTRREREVLGLMAHGMTNVAICQELWISDKTLESHVARIYGKLGLPPCTTVHRRVAAVLTWHTGAAHTTAAAA